MKSEETRWLTDSEQDLWRTLREFLWQFPSAMDRQRSCSLSVSQRVSSLFILFPNHVLPNGDAEILLTHQLSPV